MAEKRQPDPWSDPAFELAVRETAYFLWEQDGKPQGREKDYWFRALERQLRERNADRDLENGPSGDGEGTLLPGSR